MRYATALIAAAALGAAASLCAPKADAGVVVAVGLPVPAVVAPPVAYYSRPVYPYVPGPVVGLGLRFGGTGFYGHAFYGPGFRGPGFYHPGFYHPGVFHSGYFHGGFRR